MRNKVLSCFLLSALCFFFHPASGFFFFAPTLAIVSYVFLPFHLVLSGMGVGLLVDVFSVETVLGWYAFQGLVGSLILLRMKQFLFEDQALTLPLLSMAFLGSCESLERVGMALFGVSLSFGVVLLLVVDLLKEAVFTLLVFQQGLGRVWKTRKVKRRRRSQQLRLRKRQATRGG